MEELDELFQRIEKLEKICSTVAIDVLDQVIDMF